MFPQSRTNAYEHSHSKVPQIHRERSTFKRNSTWDGTFDADYLIPVYLDEVYPGDSMSVKMSGKIRLNTPIHPIMGEQKVCVEAFFVAKRLVWDNSEEFFGEQLDPDSSTNYVIPTRSETMSSSFNDTLVDCLGLPVNNGAAPTSLNVLPFRCYHKIRDEWYRDQNLQDSSDVVTDDTSNIIKNGTWFNLHKRCKIADYITGGLPWPQKFEETTLPLGTSAPITGLGIIPPATGWAGTSNTAHETGGTVDTYSDYIDNNLRVERDAATNFPKIEADLSNALAPSVNQFRTATAIQQFNEIYARCGSRYPEVMRGQFGVESADARLQRPELLGMKSVYMDIYAVPQTSSTDATTPQGNLSAFGEVNINGLKLFSKSFTEHGYLMILVSVVNPRLTYCQGKEKLWSRSTKLDYMWPVFHNLGEQATLSQELYCDGTSGDQDVLNYVPRHEELRYKTSHVTGLFRPTRSSNLAAWNLCERFLTRPTFGGTFIQSNLGDPLDRAIAVPTEPHYMATFSFRNKSARVLPVYSVPGLGRI